MNSTPDPAAHCSRAFAWATGAGLSMVILLAAWARFTLPLPPISDADTWGYLHPALAEFTGGGFQHTFGRNFVYPGWVYLLLRFTGDFRAISVAQHLLGLATVALLWLMWRQWRAWFEASWLPAWADAALGLGLAAFYGQSAGAIHYEHGIRPEAIFPFFAAAELCLQLAFLRRWFVGGKPVGSAVFAGLAVFDAVLLFQIKPSFGLAFFVALVPLLVAGWKAPAPMRSARWRLVVAAGLATIAAAICFAWPEHRLSRGDDAATLFLPETLLTVHADIVRDQMTRDLANGLSDAMPLGPSPQPAGSLAAERDDLAREIARAATSPLHKHYATLGFDPDVLMYSDTSFCYRHTRPPISAPEFAAFARGYYLRAWMHQPARMIGKVLRQLGVFYSIHCPAFWPVKEVKIDRPYRVSVRMLAYESFQPALAYPPAQAYLAEARRLGESDQVCPQPWVMIEANTAASVGYLPLLGLFLVCWAISGLAWVGWLKSESAARLFVPGLVALALFQGFNFGNCLTIAIVHSLDVARYSHNLLVFNATLLFAEIAWLCEFALCLVAGRRPVPQGDLPPS